MCWLIPKSVKIVESSSAMANCLRVETVEPKRMNTMSLSYNPSLRAASGGRSTNNVWCKFLDYKATKKQINHMPSFTSTHGLHSRLWLGNKIKGGPQCWCTPPFGVLGEILAGGVLCGGDGRVVPVVLASRGWIHAASMLPEHPARQGKRSSTVWVIWKGKKGLECDPFSTMWVLFNKK